MSLAANLLQTLAETQANEDDKTLVIDNYLRTIHIPKGITNLGVEYDDEVLLLNFRMPRYLDKTDLSQFPIRINYLNQRGESDIYDVPSSVVGSDYITFSWLVGPTATAYKGKTKFNVCLKECDSEGYVLREYNTTVASLPVLEGLEADPGVVSEYSDILEQWRQQLFGVGATEEGKITETSEAEQQKIVNKGAEVLATIPPEYTETSAAANDAVRTKGDAIVCTAEGEAIAVADSSDDYLRGLKLFGKTAQVTTTGKNLLPTKNGVYGLRNGLTFTDLGDGRVNITGIASANTTFVYCPFDVNTRTPIPAGTYTVSGSPEANVYLSFFVYASQETTDILMNNASICRGKSWTFTIDQDAYYGAYLYIGSGRTANETISAQLEIGSVATDYEPYSGGIVSPSPDWPQELVSIENPNLDIYGKNLIQNTLGTATNSGITYTQNEDGSVTVNGTATDNSYYTFDFNNPIPAYNTNMVLSIEGGAGLVSATLGYFKSDGSVVNTLVYAEDNSVTFKYPYEAVKTRIFLTVTTGKTCNNVVVRPMVRLAETNATFDGSKAKQSISLIHTLSGIPVESDGNYTDSNGQQWICDEVDFERGVYVQRIREIVIDGTQAVATDGVEHNPWRKYVWINAYPAIAKHGGLCDKLLHKSSTELIAGNAADNAGFNLSEHHNVIYFNIGNWMTEDTVDAATTALAERPLTIKYALRNPIETPLTADELAAFKALRSNYPNTTVLNDSGVHMELKYNADTKTYVDNNIKASVTDVMEAIENGSY